MLTGKQLISVCLKQAGNGDIGITILHPAIIKAGLPASAEAPVMRLLSFVDPIYNRSLQMKTKM